MKKSLLVLCFLFTLQAEDKSKVAPQPTIEERISLMQQQRDWLIADRQAHDKADNLDKQAQALATKYNCKSWNPDFTCVVDSVQKDKEKK